MANLEAAAALYRQGRLAEAAAAYETLLRDDPSDADGWYQASVVFATGGDLERAREAALRAVAIRPNSAPFYAQAGALFAATRRLLEAIPYLERAAALDPARADVRSNLGAVLRAAGRGREAIPQFQAALERRPGFADAAGNLGAALIAENRASEAIDVLEAAIAVNAPSAALEAMLGKALAHASRTDDALAALARAIAIDPAFPDTWATHGTVLEEAGDLEGARRAFERAIELAPGRGEFYYLLASLNAAAISPSHLANLERLARETSGDRIEIDFALGKILERTDPERAFSHYRAGNAAVRRARAYNEAESLGSMERIAATFTPHFIAQHAAAAHPSDVPIFIVGMPRSGTTLIEQILASHPDVHGAGELTAFDDAIEGALGIATVETMNAATDAALRDVGDRYLATAQALAPGATRIVDKMPMNFRLLGLIRIAFPNARIIHARRNPLDTCFSCYTIHFASAALAWTSDLGELGRYYRAYAALMQHWRETLGPGAMLEVHYEEVVGDIEAQARRIIAHCGLAWDDRCLEFYNTRRPVKTASVAQVRKPIYTTSTGRARTFAPYLGPLLRELAAPVSPRPFGASRPNA